MKYDNKNIDVDDPFFLLSEVSEVTGIPKPAINSWNQRQTIDIGTKHRSGRLMYSVVDMVLLAIVGDLVNFTNAPPGLSAKAAHYAVETSIGLGVRKRLKEITARDRAGKMRYKGLKDEAHLFMILWFENGVPSIKIESGTGWFSQYSWPHPFICMDLDSVIFRIVNRAFDVLERDGVEEAHMEQPAKVKAYVTIEDVNKIPSCLIDDPNDLKSNLAYQELLKDRRLAAKEKRRRKE